MRRIELTEVTQNIKAQIKKFELTASDLGFGGYSSIVMVMLP